MSWFSDQFSKRNLQVLSNPFDSRNLGSIQHAVARGEDVAHGKVDVGTAYDSLKEDPAGAAAVESSTAVDSKAKFQANRQADVLANKAGMGGGYGDKFRQKQMDTYDPNVSSERDRFGSGVKSAAAAMALYGGGQALMGGEAGAAGAGAGDLAAADAGAGLIPAGESGAASMVGGGTGIEGSSVAYDPSTFNENGLPQGSKYAQDIPTQSGGGGFNWQTFAQKAIPSLAQMSGAGGAGGAGGNSDQIAHQLRMAELLRQQKEYDDRTERLMKTAPPRFEGGYSNAE